MIIESEAKRKPRNAASDRRMLDEIRFEKKKKKKRKEKKGEKRRSSDRYVPLKCYFQACRNYRSSSAIGEARVPMCAKFLAGEREGEKKRRATRTSTSYKSCLSGGGMGGGGERTPP